MNNVKSILSMLILFFTILSTVMPTPAAAQGQPPQGPPPGAGTLPSQSPSSSNSAPDENSQEADPGTGQPPAAPKGFQPQQMEAMPQPSDVEPEMNVARSVVAGSEMNLWINQGCNSQYYVHDSIEFSVDVGDWSAYYPQQSWWRYLEVWGSTDGAWWHPVISGRWVQPTDSIVESGRISQPVGDELLYARLLDPQGNEVAWAMCEFTTHKQQQPATYKPVIELLRTGKGHAGSVVKHALVFRVKAYDPYVGTHDGDGIAYVDMAIYNWHGYKVYSKRENYAGYCGFGGGTPYCSVYYFGYHNYRWPNGTYITHGEYTLKATAYTHDGRYATLHKTITIK